jgi:hypothetical protein
MVLTVAANWTRGLVGRRCRDPSLFDVTATRGIIRYDVGVSSPARARLVAVVGLVLGCELTMELGAYAPLDGETTAAVEADTGSESTEAGSESGSSGGESETGDGDGEPGDGDGDGDGLCRIDGSEDPCQICLEFLCCEQLENCDVESGCNCMVACLLESDPVTCAMTCTPGLAYFQLLQCQAMSCEAVCE